MVAHGLELLQLVGGENSSELAPGVLLDSLELFTTLVAREAGVRPKSGHFLLLSGEDRLQLRGLIICKIEAFADALRGLVGIEAVVATVLIRRLLLGGSGIVCRLLRGLLAEGCRRGETECQS